MQMKNKIPERGEESSQSLVVNIKVFVLLCCICAQWVKSLKLCD